MTQIPRPLLLVPLLLSAPSFLLFSCMPDFASLSAGAGGACARDSESCAGSTGPGGGLPGGGGLSGAAGKATGGRAGMSGTAGEGGASGTGEGGASGTGEGGASAGAAGANGGTSSGSGGTAGKAGSSGASGTGGSGPPPCGGCAVLSSPITMSDTSQGVLLSFATPVDLSGAIITVRLRAPGATGGALQIYVQDLNFKGDYTFFTGLISYSSMTNAQYPVPATSTTYDPTQIKQIVVQLAAGAGTTCTSTSTSCTWAQPTVLEIDSITITGTTGTPPGPYTFDSNWSPLVLSAYMPITGSTLTWIP
jgi:hypothetical protein